VTATASAAVLAEVYKRTKVVEFILQFLHDLLRKQRSSVDCGVNGLIVSFSYNIFYVPLSPHDAVRANATCLMYRSSGLPTSVRHSISRKLVAEYEFVRNCALLALR